MKILQRYTITTNDHRTRTRFTFFESMVRIDTLVVSNRKIEGNDEGADDSSTDDSCAQEAYRLGSTERQILLL